MRPEHLDITSTGWSLVVEAVEMLGAERLTYGRWTHGNADELVIIRTEEGLSAPAIIGSTLCVTPRPGKIHHFDASTGQRKAVQP